MGSVTATLLLGLPAKPNPNNPFDSDVICNADQMVLFCLPLSYGMYLTSVIAFLIVLLSAADIYSGFRLASSFKTEELVSSADKLCTALCKTSKVSPSLLVFNAIYRYQFVIDESIQIIVLIRFGTPHCIKRTDLILLEYRILKCWPSAVISHKAVKLKEFSEARCPI
ncbi:MAG: hypothetical protein ACFFE8_02580 [Candidatus Heimdallarchaeota archaeon]